MPTLWDLLRRLPAVRWVAIQVGLAALMAALARAPRLGRPRPAPPSGADRPAEHALALGTLLARADAAPYARELLDRYRRWRHPAHGTAGEARTPRQQPAPTIYPVRRLRRANKTDFFQHKAILEWMTTNSTRKRQPSPTLRRRTRQTPTLRRIARHEPAAW